MESIVLDKSVIMVDNIMEAKASFAAYSVVARMELKILNRNYFWVFSSLSPRICLKVFFPR